MSRRKRRGGEAPRPEVDDEEPASSGSGPSGSLPSALAALGAGLCATVALVMIVLFARAIPDAMARARDGRARVAESACAALRPEPVNAALGALPATAPDFKLKDYAGREVRLADLRGSVVLVNFWATWCSTCVVEMPSMERLVERMAGRPFRLLAISVDEDWPEVRRFFAKGTPLEVLLDPQRTVPRAYGTEKFPESFLIDRDGTVRYYIVSNRDWSTGDVTACVEGLLQ
jgi:peroxiredoxin